MALAPAPSAKLPTLRHQEIGRGASNRRRDLLATWGLFRPRILAPAGAAAWSEDADSRGRRATSSRTCGGTTGPCRSRRTSCAAIYWFQPLMWMACRQLRRESEHACDDAVLGTGVAPDAYAGHLLQIARCRSVRLSLGAGRADGPPLNPREENRRHVEQCQ